MVWGLRLFPCWKLFWFYDGTGLCRFLCLICFLYFSFLQPNCNTTVTLQGNYGGGFCPVGPHGPVTTCYPTIYTAITNPQYSPTAVYVEGSGIAVDLPGQIDAAVQAVQQADTVVMCLGLDQTQEAEQLDR